MLENSKNTTSRLRGVAAQLGDSFSIIAALAYAIWACVAFFAGAAITAVWMYFLNRIGIPVDSLSTNVQQAIFAAITYLLALVIAIGIPHYVAASGTSLKDLGTSRLVSWTDIGLAIVGFIPYIAISIVITLVATALFAGFDVSEVQDVGFSGVLSRHGVVLAFITLVVIAPAAEELLFRGYLYGKIKKHIGTIGAIVLTSLCFGLIHLQANVAVDVFALSIILCLLREITGSIWAGMVLHMIKNGLAFYLLFIVNFI